MTPIETKDIQLHEDGSATFEGKVVTPTCANCNRPMRHNVPRLGASAGWVHADTGRFECGVSQPDAGWVKIEKELK